MFYDPDHLKKTGYGYFGHMKNALSYSVVAIFASFCFLIHAFLPFIFVLTGRQSVDKIKQLMEKNTKK